MNTQHKLLSSCPVSCFADEIAESLDRQIEVLSRLGISYVELRSADGINVSDFTMNFAKEVKKKLDQANIRISAIGSPIGKILLMFVKQIFEDFENLENKKESNLNKTCCCRPAVNSYNESGQIYLYNSIARA